MKLQVFGHIASQKREYFGVCDGIHHWQVEDMIFDEKIGRRCSVTRQGSCDMRTCGDSKAFDPYTLPRGAQYYFDIKVSVPPMQALVLPFTGSNIKFFYAGNRVRAYHLVDGIILKHGQSIYTCEGKIVLAPVPDKETFTITCRKGKLEFVSSLTEEKRRKEAAEIKCLEEERQQEEAENKGRAAERAKFAREQYEQLYELGFRGAAYQVIEAAGPGAAADAVAYAYQLYDRRNGHGEPYKVIAYGIVGELDKVMAPAIWCSSNSVRQKMKEFGLPMPESTVWKNVIAGAKKALEVGLPGKRADGKKHHEKKIVAA